jgi:hypothetical protein
VPGVDTPLEALVANFGEALVLRGYSPRTREVYLGHLRRFLEWCGEGSPRLPSDLESSVQSYIVHVGWSRPTRSYR